MSNKPKINIPYLTRQNPSVNPSIPRCVTYRSHTCLQGSLWAGITSHFLSECWASFVTHTGPEVPDQQPSEEPDLTESWATDSSSAPPDLPGTAPPLPPNITPEVESTPLEENLPSPSSSSAGEGGEGEAEAGAEGTPAGEEGVGGLPHLEEVSVDLGRSLDQALIDIDAFLDTQTSSSRLPKEEKVEEEEKEGLEVDRKGRILVKVHDRKAVTGGSGRRVWSGVLLLIGLLSCVTV